MRYRSIRPGQPWLDTSGNRIQAHGGSIITVGDTFYWYGENKERTKHGSGIWHWGVRCYASQDLYNWEDRGLIIPPVLDDPASPLHPSQAMDRPHIIYNRASGQFVCWIKVMGGENGHAQKMTVLVAESLLGPYRIVRTGLKPLGMHSGDFDLAVEPSDGKAYIFFERVHSELICADLSPDYTDVSGHYSTHFPHPQPPFVREAPAYFRRNGRHYLITSGTTGYFPNPSELAWAPSFHGPWAVLGNPHRDDPTGTSHQSQISSVFQHPHRRDLYIALADRWLPNLPPGLPDAQELFYQMFAHGMPMEAFAVPPEVRDPDTSVADYVWLPLRFEGDMVFLDWHDEWRLEEL